MKKLNGLVEIDGNFSVVKLVAGMLFIRRAVAYVHHSVMRLGGNEAQEISRGTQERDNGAQAAWEAARDQYSTFRNVLISQPEQGMKQNWQGLARQLGAVVESHPTIKVRIEAKRYLAGVHKVLERKQQLVDKGLTKAVLPTAAARPTQPSTVSGPSQPSHQ